MPKKTKRRSPPRQTNKRPVAAADPLADEARRESARPQPSPDERVWYWVAGAFVVAGAVLRFWDLAGKSLWFDEALSLEDSKNLAIKFGSGFHPPLFYFLLHAWALIAGKSDAALRLVAAVPGVLTLPVVFLAARRMFGPRAAAFATGLLAFASLHVEFSQEVRMYALATFFVGLATWLLAEATERTDRKPAWRWGVAAAYTAAAYAAMATHYLAAFVIAAQALALVCAFRTHKALVLRLATLQIPAIAVALVALAATGYSRKVAVAADFFANQGGVNQTIFSDLGGRTVQLPISFFLQVLPGFNLKWLVIASYRWEAVAIFDVCASVGLLWLTVRRAVPVARKLLVLIPAILPLLATILMVGPEQLRFYVVAAPAVAIAIGAGLDALRPRYVGVASLGLILVFSTFACWWYFEPGMDKQPWRPVATLIGQQARPNDIVLVNEPHQIIAFEHYWTKQPGVDVEPYPEVGGTRINPDDLDRWFFPLIRGRDRVWFVRMSATASHTDPDNLALKWLTTNMHRVSAVTKRGYNGDIEVTLFEK